MPEWVGSMGWLALFGAADNGDKITILVGAFVALVGSYVGYRTYQANRSVGMVTTQAAATDAAVMALKEALARTDVERERDRLYFESRLTSAEARRVQDNERCDMKLRQLGHIVRGLGGEVPDELNGLNG